MILVINFSYFFVLIIIIISKMENLVNTPDNMKSEISLFPIVKEGNLFDDFKEMIVEY